MTKLKKLFKLKNLKGIMTLNFWIKFFLVWLLLQFILHTFVTFKLGMDQSIMTIVWAWKEILIVWLVWYLCYESIKRKSLKRLFANKRIAILQIALIATIIVTFLLSVVRHGQDLGIYLMAFKYDLFGFVIFFTFYHIWWLLSSEWREQIIKRYINIFKTLLVLWAIWWLIVNAYPAFFELFWYSTEVYEANVWEAPPILYWTQMHFGYLRNQFIFERPISYGFFLIAFWPLFYLHFLKRRVME